MKCTTDFAQLAERKIEPRHGESQGSIVIYGGPKGAAISLRQSRHTRHRAGVRAVSAKETDCWTLSILFFARRGHLLG